MRVPLVVLALLAPLPAQEHFDTDAWNPLFDGATLEGWTDAGGRYDGDARWTVEDGAITGREGPGAAGGLLYTAQEYADFRFTCEAKIAWPFDSGVFLRMVPRREGLRGPQLTLDHRPGGEIGAVYADGFLKHNREGASRWRRGEWNRIELEITGQPFRLRAWLNGEPLTDHRLPEGTTGFARTGRIGLQVHGTRGEPSPHTTRFRDLRVLPLPTHDPRTFDCTPDGRLTLTDHGRQQGWRSLFNGRDLDGWRAVGGEGGVAVHDGILVFHTPHPGGYLRSEQTFADFELRLDFRIGRMANSGVFLRGDPAGGRPSGSGCEIQILDDVHWEEVTGTDLRPYQFTGGLYGSVAPAHPALHPLGRWNSYRIRYVGPRLAVWLNGRLLYDVDTRELPVPEGWKPFPERARSGFLGLQRHAPAQAKGPYAAFRNLFVRRID